MPQCRCLVCGCSDVLVEKMHYFPSNAEKSKVWQESMGMKYMHGFSFRNYRICSRHFTDDCYLNLVTRKLRVDAVPTLYPAVKHPDLVGVEHAKLTSETFSSEPVAGCSGLQNSQNTPTVSRRSVFRGIPDLSRANGSPRKRRLMHMVENKEAYIRKLKRMYKKKSGDVRALTELADSPAVRSLFKGMSSTTADFLLSQLPCAKRNPHGRRWTVEEKVLALALLKRSPKCYRFLRKVVALPSRTTLLTMLQKVSFQSGINEHLFRHIGDTITDDESKYCALLFDEMDIKEHVQYDSSSDHIIGLDEIPGNGSRKLANKAMVFMLQGVVRKWKQPVAFYFSNGTCSPSTLQRRITEVYRACVKLAKVCVITLICDMGTTNVKALKDMGSSVDHPYVLIDSSKVFTMYDPPHLLKCTVALFRKHHVILSVDDGVEMEARFDDIIQAHNIDKASPLIFRALHKLKSAHLAPIMQYAMKVNIAAQVMSHTVAAFIYSLLCRGELENRSIATATLIQQLDELFDSFNGSSPVPPAGKEVKCCITEQSVHLSYWATAFQKVKGWHFQRRTKTGSLKTSKPPSQMGWLTTINAIRQIWTFLHEEHQVSSIRPRALNQDALENLFGAIRGGCGCSDNPTVVQFVGSLKTQVLNGLTRHPSTMTNCEEDDFHLLSNLHTFLNVEDELHPGPSRPMIPSSRPVFPENMADDIAQAVQEGATASLSVAYVGGFIAKKMMEHLQCDICHHLLFGTSDDPHNLFISYREWSPNSERLQYPSEELVAAVGFSVTVLEAVLDENCHKPHIADIAADAIQQNVSFSWVSCPHHQDIVIKDIVRTVCRIGIPWWCKRSNQENLQTRKEARQVRRKMRKFNH